MKAWEQEDKTLDACIDQASHQFLNSVQYKIESACFSIDD
jgi:hypothetical protein